MIRPPDYTNDVSCLVSRIYTGRFFVRIQDDRKTEREKTLLARLLSYLHFWQYRVLPSLLTVNLCPDSPSGRLSS